MRWMAQLKADAFDLETLHELFSGRSPRVELEQDGHFLIADDFTDLADAEEVRAAAESILRNMNGVARMHHPSHRQVQLSGQFVDEESRVHAIAAPETITLRSRADLVVVRKEGEKPPPPPPPKGPVIVELAQKNPNVADALRLLGAPQERLHWSDLYKLFEIVGDDVGGENEVVRHGWAGSSQLKRFRASANRQDISGDEARHARNLGAPPRRIMSESEASVLVRHLVRRWIDWRLNDA